ncbi:transcriptional repressor [bacterium]|nr:transcriptional repressor [bacterium]
MQRKTGQREAIKRAIREAERPVGPLEIRDLAEAYSPGVGIATIYRTVKSLLETGWLAPVEIPGGPTLYELAAKPHHHHFHCRECGKVFEVHGCAGHFQKMTPPGFQLEGHEVILRGLCDQCSAKSKVPQAS